MQRQRAHLGPPAQNVLEDDRGDDAPLAHLRTVNHFRGHARVCGKLHTSEESASKLVRTPGPSPR